MMNQITQRLRDDQAEVIEQIAGRENRSVAEVIRTLIDVGLFIFTGELAEHGGRARR